MKATSDFIRKLLILFSAVLFIGFSPSSKATDTVLEETYYRQSFQNFGMIVEASHLDDGLTDDDPPTWGNSNLYVDLTIIVRDPDGLVYSSSYASYQFSGGEIEELSFSEGMSAVIIPNKTEPGLPGYEAYLTLEFDFSPPGTWDENYSIEVLLTKYNDSNDDHDVDYTIQ